MAELKPCPFCGGKPYLETRHRAFINGETTRVAFVRCTECEARTQRFSIEVFGRTSKWKAMQNPVKITPVETDMPPGWQKCVWCGTPFKPKNKRPQKYCQAYCQASASRARVKEKENGRT